MDSHELLYLSRTDVERVALDMATIIILLEAAFVEKAHGRVQMAPETGITTQPDAFILAMAAHIPALRSVGLKWVSGYPRNAERGLPYISGLLVLNDDETGLPCAVMDCTWITAHRTGAASALAARHLARKQSEVVGILACGQQGRANLLAIATLFPVKRAYAYDILPDARATFAEEMSTRLGIEVVGVNDPRQAVEESDIIVTSGPILKHPEPTIDKDWLRPGAFASAVDFDSYWTSEALAQFTRIATDDHAQFRHYRRMGYLQATPDPYADLGEIVAGLKPGRETDAEQTMAMNLGLAMDDVAIAAHVYRHARDRGIGTALAL